ncbi:MAG: hypothetical protein HY543_12175 [Deltaproteobacteria bacterium]|nr:hypothetical protein [Deltaproteobacteria bacterium]
MSKRKPPIGEDVVHYHAIVLEEVRSKMDLIAEALAGLRTELKEDIRTLREEFGQRMDTLEMVVRGHSIALQRLDQQIETVRTEFKADMGGMERRLSAKIDGHAGRLDDHEGRIVKLEQYH